MSLRVTEVDAADRRTIGASIRGLERGISYPYGADRFEIDHGSDYFAFFDRLGDTSTFAVFDGDVVVACATGVLRAITRPSGAVERAWYACDLKVAPSHRGQRIPLRILLRALRRHYRRCPRGYGVAMRPSDGRLAPVVRLASHIGVIGTSVGPALGIYELDAASMSRCAPIIARHRGDVGYLSLRGRKDLVMQSTSAPLPLLHVQFGQCARSGRRRPEPGYRHMFCVPSDDPLESDLRRAGFTPSAHADILQHRMADWDWSFVLTSDL